MNKLLRAFTEVIRDYTFVATYGIPLLWIAELIDFSFWVWVLIMFTHTITSNSLKVLEERYDIK